MVVNDEKGAYLGRMKRPLLLGSHMSINGGMHTAFERGTKAGCATMQVFTKNGNRWAGKQYSREDIQNYTTAAAKSTIAPVIAHASYLINLCAASADILGKSRAALEDELRRCEILGIAGLVLHPGAHTGRGEPEGMRIIVESLNTVHAATSGFRTRTLLETTAGQGSTLGYRFEQLRGMMDLVDDPARVAVCLDTCHVFAAGYDITTEAGWEETMRAFDNVIGFPRLAAVHVNDSKKPRGSRVDRHDHIGKGLMGLTTFRMLVNDPRFEEIPKILETEKSDDLHEDIENMTLLRSLVAP
jgi:deoxyribonuclease-4